MANKKRLIDANALECALKDTHIGLAIDKGKMFRLIENAPTVDAVEVVHSEWFLNGDGSGSCMSCGKRMKVFYDECGLMKFCPYCGAKMDGR